MKIFPATICPRLRVRLGVHPLTLKFRLCPALGCTPHRTHRPPRSGWAVATRPPAAAASTRPAALATAPAAPPAATPAATRAATRAAALAGTLVAVLLALTATEVAWAQDPANDLPFDPAVRRGSLSNGLVYYVRANAEPPNRAQLRLVVRAGSVLEQEHERGLAHFVEHMAFNGTARFAGNEIIDYLESIGSGFGPDVNAYTSFDETVYQLEVPTDDATAVETGFQILSDWAYAISFDPEELERERGVVLEEWRTGRGASARLNDQQFPVLFGASQYAERLPIGLPEILETATVADLRGFYQRWYRPDLMAVIAVGDFDPDTLEAAVRHHFAPPPEGAAELAQARRPEPPTDRPQFTIPAHADTRVSVATDPEMSATVVSVYRKLPAHTGQDVAAYRRMVVDSLFAGMINARLFERGQVADPPYIWAGVGYTRLVGDAAALIVRARVDQDGIERGFDTLLEEGQRVLSHGFTATELARQKADVLRWIESAWQERDQRQSHQLAEEYVRHFLEGEPVPGIEAEYALHEELLPEISLADVNQVAAPWRELANTVVLVSGPEGVATGDEAEQALLAQLAAGAALQVDAYEDVASDLPLLAELPEPGSITIESEIAAIDAVWWQLSNGATVIAKQTDFQNDEVLLSATSPGGASLAADADYIAAITASAIAAGSGVGAHDRVALDKLLAGNTAEVGPYIGNLFEGFSGSSSPQDLETLFQLITLYATAPRLDPTYFAAYSSRLQSQVENRLAQPDAVFADTVRSALSQNHFRARPLTLELLEELDLERSTAVYADRFQDFGDFTFVIVGAFDWDELRSLTARYLAALPAAARQERWRDMGVDPPPGVVDRAVYRGVEERSITRLVFAGEMAWSREEALTLLVLSEMLQIRLRERVREELGGTYSIGVWASANLLPDPEYRVSVGFGSDPERADELLGEVFSGIDWLSAGGEQSYLDKAKELLLTIREEQLRRNGFWLAQIESVVERGEQFNAITGFDQRLEALTLEQVAAAAQRYLDRDRYVRVVLLPEAVADEYP